MPLRRSTILMAESKKLYLDQKKAKAEVMKLLTDRYNTGKIFGMTKEDKQRKQRQGER